MKKFQFIYLLIVFSFSKNTLTFCCKQNKEKLDSELQEPYITLANEIISLDKNIDLQNAIINLKNFKIIFGDDKELVKQITMLINNNATKIQIYELILKTMFRININ